MASLWIVFIIPTASLESVGFYLGLFIYLICGALFLGLEFLLFEDFTFIILILFETLEY